MTSSAPTPVAGSAAKLIRCLLPDDGTDRRLLRRLRDQQGITRANSTSCRGVSILRDATTRRGKLPEPELARLVTVIVDADRADTLFAFIYAQAHIGRPGGGAVTMAPLAVATSFLMPADVPNEPGETVGSK